MKNKAILPLTILIALLCSHCAVNTVNININEDNVIDNVIENGMPKISLTGTTWKCANRETGGSTWVISFVSDNQYEFIDATLGLGWLGIVLWKDAYKISFDNSIESNGISFQLVHPKLQKNIWKKTTNLRKGIVYLDRGRIVEDDILSVSIVRHYPSPYETTPHYQGAEGEWRLVKSSKKYEISTYLFFSDEGRKKIAIVKEAKVEANNRYPELFVPIDEFETNAEYTQRIAKQHQMVKKVWRDLIAEQKTKESEAERLAIEQAEEKERQRKIKIAESLAPAEFTLYSIGSYNPENGTFPLILDKGPSYTVKIPRSEARDFKENYRTAKVEGYKRLERDLKTYEYFNMVVIHPITGSRFPFGPTKDLAAAPVIASKKSVVPPDLSMRVAFVEPNGNGFLDAEEKGKIKVSISNSGKGSAMGVFVKLNAETSNREITAGTSKIIGEVPAGQTKTTEFEINASKSVTRMENRFTVSATESYGFPPDPAQISFETFPFIPPKLKLVDFGISTPNEGNEIRPQTTTEVQARVQNRGQGPAEDVQFSINLPKGVYFTPDSRQDYSFSSLNPGEFKDLEFSFNTAKTVGKTIDVSIGFTEESTTGKFPLDLEVAKPQKTIQQLVVKGQEMGTVEFADVATVSVDIEKDIPKSGRKGKHDLAVVFGIESYKNIPGVSFARRDATWMKKYFENVLGIPQNRIYYKTDSDVGQAEFSKVFSEDGWLDKRVKEGKTNLYVYYAGHGAPDMKKNKAYLIPYDGDPNYASQTGYEMDALYEQLGNLGAASVTVFLDACFSGANRDNEMLLADARPVFMEVDASATRDVTVFSAAGGKEISSAWPEKKHGLFSYYLMKGMRGDADANNDNQITVGELGDYVKENVSDMAGMLDREQTPGLQTLDKEKVLISY